MLPAPTGRVTGGGPTNAWPVIDVRVALTGVDDSRLTRAGARDRPLLDRHRSGSPLISRPIGFAAGVGGRVTRGGAITSDLFLLKRRWMKQSPFRIVHARSVLATIVLVALGAASSSAQSSASSPVPADAITRPDPRRCPSSDAGAVGLPEGIQVSDDLRPRLHAMLEKSATFRSQCRRIGQSRQLYVRVRLDARITGRTYRAVTRIRRHASGTIVAAVDIAAYGDPTEWVAHEFEHLIEQLDGVNLHDLERRGQGAWKSGNQMFETERAVSVGRRVSREMREPAITARLAEPAAAAGPAAVGPALR